MATTTVDFVSNLPVEIAEMILSYLEGKELVRCRLVCKTWCSLTYNDLQWKRLCHQEYPEELLYRGSCKTYGELWRRGAKSEAKWATNEYWNFDTKQIVEAFPLANGAILGLMHLDSSLTLYDLNVPGGKTLQVIPPFSNGPLDPKQFHYFTCDDFIIFSNGNMRSGVSVYTFHWKEDRLHLKDRLYCRKNRRGVQIHRGEGTPSSGLTLKRLLKGCLVWRDWNDMIDYFYDGQQITGSVKWETQSWRDHGFGDTYFLCTRNAVTGYDIRGSVRICLDVSDVVSPFTGDDINLNFNEEVILVLIAKIGRKTGTGWLWSEPSKMLPAKIATKHDLALHPKNRQVIYIAQSDNGIDKYEVITRALDTDEIVHSIKFTLPPHRTMASDVGYFIMSDYRHAVYMLYYRLYEGMARKDQHFVDLASGRIIFIENWNTFSIKRVTSKYLQNHHFRGDSRIYNLRVFT